MKGFISVAALVLVLAFSALAFGETLYYASATSASYDGFSGTPAYWDQFVGVRFAVDKDVTVSAIGGCFRETESVGNHKIFGAVVALNSFSDFPDSKDLSTPDILASVAINLPVSLVDVVTPITPLDLKPGVYGVVFGSGTPDANGVGVFPKTTNIDQPSYFFKNSNGDWVDGGLPACRLTVYSAQSVPEPSSLALLIVVALGIASVAIAIWETKRGENS